MAADFVLLWCQLLSGLHTKRLIRWSDRSKSHLQSFHHFSANAPSAIGANGLALDVPGNCATSGTSHLPLSKKQQVVSSHIVSAYMSTRGTPVRKWKQLQHS